MNIFVMTLFAKTTGFLVHSVESRFLDPETAWFRCHVP